MLWYLFEFEYVVYFSYQCDRDSLWRFFFCPSKEKGSTEKGNNKKNSIGIDNNMKYKAPLGLLVLRSLFIDLMSEVYYSVLNNC